MAVGWVVRVVFVFIALLYLSKVRCEEKQRQQRQAEAGDARHISLEEELTERDDFIDEDIGEIDRPNDNVPYRFRRNFPRRRLDAAVYRKYRMTNKKTQGASAVNAKPAMNQKTLNLTDKSTSKSYLQKRHYQKLIRLRTVYFRYEHFKPDSLPIINGATNTVGKHSYIVLICLYAEFISCYL